MGRRVTGHNMSVKETTTSVTGQGVGTRVFCTPGGGRPVSPAGVSPVDACSSSASFSGRRWFNSTLFRKSQTRVCSYGSERRWGNRNLCRESP